MSYTVNIIESEAQDTKDEDFFADLCTLLQPQATTKKRIPPEKRVENRRKVEEILFDKQYQEVYGDPFEDEVH